ncbi:uncharacterized protein [Chironomus tepperi]|uniref:uncharacterized protein n=1 Tax=Chironomus tepperi TaxID=113505 RepID=UPI00391F2E64
MSYKMRNKDVQFQNVGNWNEKIPKEQIPTSIELSIIHEKCGEHFIKEAHTKQVQNNDQSSWFQNIKTIENIHLILNQFENVTKALRFLNNLQYSTIIQKVLVVMLSIDEDIESVSQTKLKMLGYKLSKKSVIIIIICKELDKPLIFWKSEDIGHFLTLKSYSNMLNVYEFIGMFLINSLKIGHLGIFKFISAHQDTKVIELNFLADLRDYNLLLLAAETGDVIIAERLLKLEISTNSSNKDIDAQLLAYKNGHYDVLLMFLQNNLTYPSTIDISSCSVDIKEFHQVSVKLHNSIVSGNEDNILQIMSQHPNQRHFYNSKNQSAPTVALINKQTDIYKLLITNNVHFGPHESTDEIMENFEYAERRDLREFHNQHAKDLPEKHLNALMTSSVVAHDVTDVNRKPDLVMGAFKLLNEIMLIRIILKVVAASKKLQMVFDFNRESVEVADPTVDSKTFGLFYLTGRIYIGALQLLNNGTKYETLGTMAHELCHYAMHLTFGNDANPYRKDDKVTKAEFEKISKHCRKNCESNGFIKAVYDEYPDEAHHAELIVRVPHILAFYADEPEEIEENQQIFKPLFDFYEHKVVPEMEKALPDIETRIEREIEQKDKKIVNLFKIIVILVISSIVVVGLLVLVLYKPELKYETLSGKDQQIVRNSIVKYKNVKVKFNDLIPDNSTVYKKLSSDHLRTLIDNDVLDLNDPLLKFTDDHISHKWQTLPKQLRQKFLSSNFTFQNHTLKLNDFFEEFPKVFDKLSHQQIYDVLDGSNLTIGTLHKSSIDNYIERKFLVQNSKKVKNLTQIIEVREKSKLVILSAVAGAGKTVTFEYLTYKIKDKFPKRWVSYVDLKKYTYLYNETNPFVLLTKILNLDQKSKFEQEIFKKTFEIGKVDILWNGFDEISPTYSKFVTEILKNIKEKTKNIQFISTRPSYAQELQSSLKVVPYELIPLKKIEQNRFLIEYFGSQSKNTTIINQNVEKVENILKTINVGESRDFNTPLMLKMVAEILDDPKLINSTNLYGIYELFIIKKNRIWYEKGELAKSASTDIFLTNSRVNIVQIYQKFAILQEKSMFGSDGLLVKMLSLKVLKRTTFNEALFPEITRVGVLLIDDERSYEFWHRTFADFFIAQYVIENIYSSDDDIGPYEAELRLILLYQIISSDQTNLIINLMHAHIKAQNENEVAFSESILQNLKTKFRDLFLICLKRHPSQLTFLLDFIKKDHELLLELLQVNQKETLYTRTFDFSEGISLKLSHKLKNITRNYLTDEEYDKFVNGVDQKGKILVGKKFYELTHQVESTDDIEGSENHSIRDDSYDEETENSEEYDDESNEEESIEDNSDDYKESSPNEGSSEDSEEEYEESDYGSGGTDDNTESTTHEGTSEDFIDESDDNEESEESDYDSSENVEGSDEELGEDNVDKSQPDSNNSTLSYNSDELWFFINELKQNLTEFERKELLLELASPEFWSSSLVHWFNMTEFELIWKEIKDLNLTKVELKKFIAKILFDVVKCLVSSPPVHRIDCGSMSNMLMNITKELLSNDEIFEIFYNENLLHEFIKYGGIDYSKGFNPMQDFFNSVTSFEQQQKMNEKFDNGADVYSSIGYPPLKIIHLRLINTDDDSDVKYLFDGQSKEKLQKLFMSSQNFLLFAKNTLCRKLALILKEFFELSQIRELLEQKLKPLNVPIFHYGSIMRDDQCLRWLYYLKSGFDIVSSEHRGIRHKK